ncbi:uncharacterized protein LOC112087491 [Eutrema salsugineum]|uniref:uncharacterized protein LOC112087491 n=1 Tax=Eutrema salsugineum TaxID=72664 RepID=UPI000CED3716|nr:uncharacterized protein LOC112087491 [Eutrema salsugineum]
MVHELQSWEDGWTIKVKILKRWGAFDADGLRVMNFILFDENGCRISAYVGNLNLSYFEYVLQEGNWVQLSKFKLIPFKWEERTTRHVKQIILDGETKVSSIQPLTGDPFLRFVDFSRVYNKPYSHFYPVDLIGVLDHVDNMVTVVYPDDKSVPTLRFRIKDLENCTLNCVAHDDLAYEIEGKCKGPVGKSPFAICVLTDWLVKKNIDEMTIENYKEGLFSRFAIAPPLDEVKGFGIKLAKKITEVYVSASSSQGRKD